MPDQLMHEDKTMLGLCLHEKLTRLSAKR